MKIEEMDEIDKSIGQRDPRNESNMNNMPRKKGQTGQWQCAVCGVRLKTKSSWTKHKKLHDG